MKGIDKMKDRIKVVVEYILALVIVLGFFALIGLANGLIEMYL